MREILADQPINAQKLEKWIVYMTNIFSFKTNEDRLFQHYVAIEFVGKRNYLHQSLIASLSVILKWPENLLIKHWLNTLRAEGSTTY